MVSKSDRLTFKMKGRVYQASAVAAVVPFGDMNAVQIRYLDKTPDIVIADTSVERVMSLITKAKADADSA